jgi:peptidoglycan/LPS O-acetylase OafA/YrhL
MGYYRMLLALLVALSHLGISPYGLNPGITAVISFFIISGLMMTLLIRKHYNSGELIKHFYIDRLYRLFPQFIFHIALAVVVLWASKHINPDVKLAYGEDSHLSILNILLNSLMLPLGYYMFSAAENVGLILTSTWSLGLELTFYIVVPFLIVYASPKLVYTISWASLAVFMAAFIGLINTDIYGYRLLPGTLFIFLIGYAYGDREHGKSYILLMLGLFSMLAFPAFGLSEFSTRQWNKEVVLGVILGIVAVNFLRHLKPNRIDSLLGNLSYGVFLNHIIIIWLCQLSGIVYFKSADSIGLIFVLSIAFSYLTYRIVEQPFMDLRRSMRSKFSVIQ